MSKQFIKQTIVIIYTDTDLDDSVIAIVQQNPMHGEKMVSGALASKGVCVPRNRIRDAIRRVDPEGLCYFKACELYLKNDMWDQCHTYYLC